MTRLLLAPEAIAAEAISDARKWVGTHSMFGDAKSTAAYAAAEYTLSKRGLTLYEASEDKTLLDDMDKMFEGVHEQSLMRWCSGGVCACMGCVNHTAYYNHITKEQWRIWLERRRPALHEKLLEEEKYWAEFAGKPAKMDPAVIARLRGEQDE